MTTYTVTIEASNADGTIWQQLHPTEALADNGWTVVSDWTDETGSGQYLTAQVRPAAGQ